MGCWYCRWGWPKPVADIYLRAVKDIDDVLTAAGWDGEPESGEWALKWGPAHYAWEDENFEGDHDDEIARCNAECDAGWYSDWHPGALAIVKRSLRELDALPEEVRMPRPDYWDDDGLGAGAYPPPEDMEMVKI